MAHSTCVGPACGILWGKKTVERRVWWGCSDGLRFLPMFADVETSTRICRRYLSNEEAPTLSKSARLFARSEFALVGLKQRKTTTTASCQLLSGATGCRDT